MNKEPSLLKKGDAVSIISTARKVIKKDIQKSIDEKDSSAVLQEYATKMGA